MELWKTINKKKVLWYLQGAKDFILDIKIQKQGDY